MHMCDSAHQTPELTYMTEHANTWCIFESSQRAGSYVGNLACTQGFAHKVWVSSPIQAFYPSLLLHSLSSQWLLLCLTSPPFSIRPSLSSNDPLSIYLCFLPFLTLVNWTGQETQILERMVLILAWFYWGYILLSPRFHNLLLEVFLTNQEGAWVFHMWMNYHLQN